MESGEWLDEIGRKERSVPQSFTDQRTCTGRALKEGPLQQQCQPVGDKDMSRGEEASWSRVLG